MKKILWPMCLLFVLCCCRWAAVARADSPVTPFVDSQTNAVVYVNVSAIDMDQIDAMRQKAAEMSTADPAQKAQSDATAKAGIAKAKQWISDFKAAGGQDMYVLLSLSGMMSGQSPVTMIFPVQAGTDTDALGKMINPAGNTPADPNNPNPSPMAARMRWQTAVIGNNLVYSNAATVAKMKNATGGQPRQDLADALVAGGDATIRIAFSPTSIKNSPMYAMMTQMAQMRANGGAPGAPAGAAPSVPLSEPEWNNVTWVSISLSPPPKESGSFIVQCKDADSANAFLTMINNKIQDQKTNQNNNPGDTAGLSQDDMTKLAAAFKPQANGSQVVVSIDQDTMHNVVEPIMSKAMQHMQSQSAAPRMAPGMGGPGMGGPGMQPPPDNGGMNNGM